MLDIVINQINESVEIGDIVYSVPVLSTSPSGVSDAFLEGNFGSIVELGPITAFITGVFGTGITVDNTTSNAIPSTGDFLMFSKNKIANTSGLLGYYIDIDFVNDSKIKAELFQVGAITEISSK